MEIDQDFIDRALGTPDNEGQGPQGSAAWLFERVGYITASRFEDAIGKGKKGQYLAAREAYKWELVIERLTGSPSEHWTSAAMQWGSDCEQRSRMAFEAATGMILEPCGFIKHPQAKWIGCSPDALIGEDGGFESKSPYNSRYHLETLIAGMIPPEHFAQVQGGMWITGRAYWEFQSFDPRLPEPLNCFRQRVERDQTYIDKLAVEIDAFADEVNDLTARLAKNLAASGNGVAGSAGRTTSPSAAGLP